jgi:uncharacterized protein YwqG
MALAAEMIMGSIICLEPLSRATSSAQGIQSVVSNIYSYTSYPDVVNAIRRLDIEASALISENLIMELNIEIKNNTVDECKRLLKEIISDIERELGEIHGKLAYNHTITWGKYFRSYKFTTHIQNLEMMKFQLDNRIEKLLTMVNNSKHLKFNDKKKSMNELDISIIDKE